MLNNRRSGISIMLRLITLIKSLLPIMCLAILLGTIGSLCAISLTILAVKAILYVIEGRSIQTMLTILVVCAFSRGFLHYGEQYCNHFIAFKLLALIRHKVFVHLRKLCPAKLDGKDSGNILSVLTSDIELLEVFYAHTISPIAIAILVSITMILFIGQYSISCALFALLAYVVVGVFIPMYISKQNKEEGMAFRNEFGKLNAFVLESVYGLEQTLQYAYGTKRNKQIQDRSKELSDLQKGLSQKEAMQRSFTSLAIQLFSWGMLGLCIYRHLSFEGTLICTVAMMGSFGPVVALSSLSNTLSLTLASGERVLSLLEEEPSIKEIEGNETQGFVSAEVNGVTFKYEQEEILKDFSLSIPKGKIIGIHGQSGCGKSTLLKLLMRFYDVQKGSIIINDQDIKTLPTHTLRNMESYVTQSTFLFQDTIYNNLTLGKETITEEEVVEACKKASIHEFILSLPNGYQTKVGELGDTLSQGEQQRLGVARSFLHQGDILLMDEPTSNLDALNEGIILKTLKEECKDKTILLVSHRDSTMRIADTVVEMKSDRVS